MCPFFSEDQYGIPHKLELSVTFNRDISDEELNGIESKLCTITTMESTS
jgi:hypothetical protein